MTTATATADTPRFTQPTPVASFELNASETVRLIRHLRAAGVFVSKDSMRIVLTALHLIHDGKGDLTIEGTDSYRLVKIHSKLVTTTGDTPPKFDSLIPAAWLLKQLPKGKRVLGIGVDLTDETVSVHDLDDRTSATARLIGGPFPNTAQMWAHPDYDDDLGGKEFGFNPTTLAQVLKACHAWGRNVAPVRISSLDVLRPVRFDASVDGDSLSALLMPVRISTQETP